MIALRLLGYLWAMPQTILGLLLAILYRPTRLRWFDGALEAVARGPIIGRPGAQTWGWITYFADEEWRRTANLRVHERVHVRQAFFGGPLYMLAYSGHFLWLYLFAPRAPEGEPRWKRAYRRIYFEVVAYRVQRDFLEGKRPGAWGSKLPS